MTYDRSAWASLRAAELRRQADALLAPDPANCGDWRAVQRRRQASEALRAEAAKFDRIAARGGRRAA